MPAELKIHLVAQTEFHHWAAYDATFAEERGKGWETDVDGGQALAEFAGRACYQSWTKPNLATATNEGYLRHILEVGHESVLRHATATFYLEGISRSFTHELIRHHVGTDYSQLSQRYVDTEKFGHVVPPAMRGNPHLVDRLKHSWEESLEDYEAAVRQLEHEGKSRKEAREAARAFLPGCAETKIVVTGNHEAWRSIVARRATAEADAEMREVMVEIFTYLKQFFPNFYQDMQVCEGGDGITTVTKRPL